MTTLALIVAVLALLLALRAQGQASSLRARLEEAESASRRALLAAEDADQNARRNTELLKRMAGGTKVDAEMIEEGRLFPEIDSDAARRLVEDERPSGLTVLDVRTEQEVAGGHIPGALWIPVDQIQNRAREVPKNGSVLVVCAAGGRSAAACDYLSTNGWANVTNVVGGMSAYRGKTQSGLPGK
jgi:rhodanese-related sulfurtransferase